jgi:hypothetical protein
MHNPSAQKVNNHHFSHKNSVMCRIIWLVGYMEHVIKHEKAAATTAATTPAAATLAGTVPTSTVPNITQEVADNIIQNLAKFAFNPRRGRHPKTPPTSVKRRREKSGTVKPGVIRRKVQTMNNGEDTDWESVTSERPELASRNISERPEPASFHS